MFLGISTALLMLFRFCTAQSDALSNDFINSINAAQSSWRAAKVWPENTTEEFLSGLSGAVDPETYRHEYKSKNDHRTQFRDDSIPIEFDARKKWPKCQSIGKARHQGKCGSCWALAVAAAFTDRMCIAVDQEHDFDYSTEDILGCCGSQCLLSNNICGGGRVEFAWRFVQDEGVVTGGEYRSKEGCKPYSEETYKDHDPPPCERYCSNEIYTQQYATDKRYIRNMIIQTDGNVEAIQHEIMENGPVVAHMEVWTDFETYSSGVYVCTTLGRMRKALHAVKLIGWGREHSLKYWLGVNSWGSQWGDKGTFKIKRGDNHCRIEKGIMTAVVDPRGKINIKTWQKGAKVTTSKPSNSTSSGIRLSPFHFVIFVIILTLKS
ncbi:Peptidase C1 and/or Propeptide C1 domain containing protein [Asbolus verrucosus]|uniref:Peptidase C1 and/or Propeptide C1 domain containing protein n=1 Tax=Asbolus verrucosus TaxID=1661398 RepID=A0A482VCT9_ASBVE|nr:Peptidase C1 and/or Propeptide C1 domain containing protein [Asbolus verrucosus]